MVFYKQYIRQHKKQIFVFFAFCTIFFIVFALYHLPLGAVLYPMVLCSVLGVGLLSYDYKKAKKSTSAYRNSQGGGRN